MNLVAYALLSALSCHPVGGQDLVGLWESVASSRGGIGNNIEFRKDGSYVAAVTVLVDLNYEVKEGKLFTGKNNGEPVSFVEGEAITIGDTALVVKGENGGKEVRDRVTPGAGTAIVGVYKYRHYTGGIAFERFTPDGILNFRLPMSSISGCYSIDDNEISVAAQGQETEIVHYTLRAGNLLLGAEDKMSTFNRVKEGAWYESEVIDYKTPGE